MAVRKGFGVSGSGATAEDYRRGVVGEFVRNADGSVRAGVLGQVSAIVSARASMGVNVASFQAVLAHGLLSALPVQNDGTETVALVAAPASNSRIDVVFVKHNDTANGDANSTPVLGVVTGAAAASPTKPAVPANALELATVLVPAGATTTQSTGVVVSQTFPMTAASGGVVNLRSAAEQSAFNAVSGQLARRVDLDLLQVAQSSGWQRIGSGAAPSIEMAASGSLPRAQHALVDGMVELSGFGLKGPGFQGIFTLPAGRRPGKVLRFKDASAEQSVVINPDGRVDYTDTASVTVGFDGIRFRAAS